MYGFCRLGLRPAPCSRRRLRPERARDGDEHEREERRDAAEHRHRPRDEVGRAAAVEQHGGAPSSRRARAARAAASPPGRPRTRRSSSRSAARVVVCCATYVNEKSCRTSADSSTARRDGRRAERREQRVARGVGEPAPVRARGPRAGDRRVERRARAMTKSAARPRSATALRLLRGRVLRRALRHERPGHRAKRPLDDASRRRRRRGRA